MRRALQPPRRRVGLAPLQQLEHAALVPVGRGEVGVEQPVGVRRHLGEGREVVGLEVERHEVLALHRPRRRRPARARPARVRSPPATATRLARRSGDRRRSTVDGGGHGWFDSQQPQRRASGPRRAGTRARSSPCAATQPDQRRVDRLVVDLGMPAVPVLDLQPRGEQPVIRTAGPSPRALSRASSRRADQALQPLAERVVTEVARGRSPHWPRPAAPRVRSSAAPLPLSAASTVVS